MRHAKVLKFVPLSATLGRKRESLRLNHEMELNHHVEFQVSVGSISIRWNSREQITAIDWNLKLMPTAEERKDAPAHVRVLGDRIRRYFYSGTPMGRVPWEHIDRTRWTPFQCAVYEAIAQIPHGETRTYGWVAARVGRLTATRAVGQALRNNPLPILIPCHRVVAVASLGGFMGSIDPTRPELDLKRRLLSLEQDYLNPLFPFLGSGAGALG